STVALNLATILAGRGKRKVLLVEGDLRRPCLSRRLGLKQWAGLSECLTHGSDPMQALRRIEPFGFYLLPAGEPVANPSELLQAEPLSLLFRAISSRFDWILIDSAPTSPITDTLALKPRADAGLLVVRSGKTPREDVEEAIRQFGPGFVIGLIVNGLEGLDREYSDYYAKYYGGAGIKRSGTSGKPATQTPASKSA
ncbi:MAG: tyrosine-protein kinase family protein, partial [Terriglobia bacterium]